MEPILFAGGDRRTAAAIAYLERHGYKTETYALFHRTPRTGTAPGTIVLPYPCQTKGKLNAPGIPDPPTLEEVIRETGVDPERTLAIGGPLSPNPFSHYVDLSEREDLKLRNAVTTAEGALELLIRNTDRALFGTSVLMVGYGAVGRRLADLLLALGAQVTVAARKEKDRVAARLRGCNACDTAELSLRNTEILINTVPARLVEEAMLKESDPQLQILELASPPYGMDPQLPAKLGRRYIPGPALPGKVAPITAGEDLAKTLIAILSHQKTKGSGTPLGT